MTYPVTLDYYPTPEEYYVIASRSSFVPSTLKEQQLFASLTKANEKMAELQAQVNESARTNKGCCAAIAALSEEVTDLKNKNATLTINASCHSEVDNRHIATLEHENRQLADQNHNLRGAHANLTQQVATLSMANKVLTGENAALKTANQELSAKNKVFTEALVGLEQLQENYKFKQREIERLNRLVQKQQEHIQKLGQQVTVLQAAGTFLNQSSCFYRR
jgi:chromosome segregation ATPase